MSDHVHLEENEEDCEPCLFGVLLGTLREMCRLSADQFRRGNCEANYDKVVMGEITIPEYIQRTKDEVKGDKEALFTVAEVEKVLATIP